MSEYESIILVDRNYQEVDNISDAVHILAQIGDKMITRQIAPGKPNPSSIICTPDHEKYEIEWETRP